MREQGLDSLAVAEFLFEVEDRLGLTLPDEHKELETLAGLADLIDRMRAEQTA
jgi:acyl carrier protein